MDRLTGIPVSPGVTIGKALVVHSRESLVSYPKPIPEADVSKEIARFEDALTQTRAEILGIRKKILVQIGRESSDIFNAHLMILEDRTLIEDVIAIIKTKKVSSEYAFSQVLEKYFTAFADINDEYLKERVSDIRDIGRRLLSKLRGGGQETAVLIDNSVIIAHDLSPSDTAMLDKNKVLAFVTEVGGPTSHTAILGRSMEIPSIVGLAHALARIKTGDTVVVDGTHGVVIIDPDEETIQKYIQAEKKFIFCFISRSRGDRTLPHGIFLYESQRFAERTRAVRSL